MRPRTGATLRSVPVATAITSTRRAVLAWYDVERRDFPWRGLTDPYAVLVSEVMLQQTQASRVAERFGRFVTRFPDAATLAAAAPAEVLSEWSGLGYNRRAVFLHRLCVAVVERHDGELPDELGSLLALPGIGAYTARAILAFAHERDVGVVDTNIGRVMARLAGTPLDRPSAQQLADRLVPEGRGWEWNQSLLDLVARGAITPELALERSPEPSELHSMLHNRDRAPQRTRA